MKNNINEENINNNELRFRWIRVVDGIIFGEIQVGVLDNGERIVISQSEQKDEIYEIYDICRFSTTENRDERSSHFHAKVKRVNLSDHFIENPR